MNWSAIRAIAANELRRLHPDRVGLFGLALPILIMVLVGATFGSAGSVTVGVLDQDGSVQSAGIIARIEQQNGAHLRTYHQAATLRRDVRTTAIQAGLVIPPGYGASVAAGEAVELPLVLDPKSEEVATAIATINGAVAREGVTTAALDLVEASARPAHAEQASVGVTDLAFDATRFAPVRVEDTDSGGKEVQVGSFSYTAPSNLVLFVFTMTFAVSALMATDRKQGVIHRMLSAPISTGTIVTGIGLSKVVYALAQSALLLLVGSVFFGVVWGDPLAASILVVLSAVFAAAIGICAGSLVSDADQAQSVGIPIAVAAGMLGGCMWPLGIVPDALRIAGHITPQAWAMDAWLKLIFDGAGVRDIAPELTVLAVGALLTSLLAGRLLRRAVTR